MNNMLLQLRRFGVRLTADRKRFRLLCTLLAVALLFWTRLIVIKQIPRTALAEGSVELAMADPHETAHPESPVEVLLPSTPVRDPFQVSDTWFPKTEVHGEDEPLASTSTAIDPRQSLKAMRLEAAMPPTLAVIDGRTRRPGESIPSDSGLVFTVVEIVDRGVILECSDARYRLSMNATNDR